MYAGQGGGAAAFPLPCGRRGHRAQGLPQVKNSVRKNGKLTWERKLFFGADIFFFIVITTVYLQGPRERQVARYLLHEASRRQASGGSECRV